MQKNDQLDETYSTKHLHVRYLFITSIWISGKAQCTAAMNSQEVNQISEDNLEFVDVDYPHGWEIERALDSDSSVPAMNIIPGWRLRRYLSMFDAILMETFRTFDGI